MYTGHEPFFARVPSALESRTMASTSPPWFVPEKHPDPAELHRDQLIERGLDHRNRAYGGSFNWKRISRR